MQGAGGAALLSTAQATLVQIFSQAEQAVVQPIFLLGLVLFPTIGPAIGGYITDVVNWNWCFFINIPLGIISALIILFLLRDTTAPDTQTPVDWLGIALLVVGLASMQYVLEEGQQDDWFSSQVIVVMTIISFVGITGLIAWLLTPLNKHPILNIKILTNSSLSGGILLFIAVGFGVYGVNYLFPLLAQQQEGLTPLQSGLALLPGGIASTVSIVGCGILANTKLDARLQTFTGIILSAIGMFFMAHLSSQSSTNDTFWPMIIRGFSIGFLFVPVNQMAIGSLSGSDVNEGTGLLGLGRQLGGSIGVAIIATSLQNSQFVNRANMVGSLTTNNPAYVSRVADLSGVLVGHGFSHTDSQQSAVGLINQILMQQVSAKSFDDTFILLMVVSILMIPTLIMLKKPKPGAAAAPMH
jgi:DHA2 family multidrug resistance protein